MKCKDMTNGSQCVPEVDASAILVFYFTAKCFHLSEEDCGCLQAALEEMLKKTGFSKVTTHSMQWEDMTTGSVC